LGELPSSLVDWPPRKNSKKTASPLDPPFPKPPSIDKETDAEREAAESHLPQVAPGLHLPDLSGMFLLDNFKGQPQLVEIEQNEGDVNRSTRGNILRGALIPAAGAKQTIELEGEHATTYAHVAVPSIYINIDEDTSSAAPAKPSDQTAGSSSSSSPSAQQPQQPQQPEQPIVPFDRFHIVHMKVKSGKRIVGDIKRNSHRKNQSTGKFRENHHRPHRRRLAQTHPHRRPRPRRIRHSRDQGHRSHEPLRLALRGKPQRPSEHKSLETRCEGYEEG
jgi:hypothetical protein